jgi:hypothetical protein
MRARANIDAVGRIGVPKKDAQIAGLFLPRRTKRRL